MKKLSPKERKFVTEYLKDQNGTKAAIRAGYSKKTARSQGSRLLTKAHVSKAVDAALNKVEEKVLVSKEYVLRGFKEVAERSMQHTPVMEFDYEEKAMVEKKTWVEDPDNPGELKMVGIYEFDSGGANKALEMLGKSMKMFSDRLVVDVHHHLSERLQTARKRAAEAGKESGREGTV